MLLQKMLWLVSVMICYSLRWANYVSISQELTTGNFWSSLLFFLMKPRQEVLPSWRLEPCIPPDGWVKFLYSIKIWMFLSQFHLTAREEKGLWDIAIFSMRLYLRVWITAPSAIDAPFNDLQLMIDLLQYASINPAICVATSKKLSHHLCMVSIWGADWICPVWYSSVLFYQAADSWSLQHKREKHTVTYRWNDQKSICSHCNPSKHEHLWQATRWTFFTIYNCQPTFSEQTPIHGKLKKDFWLPSADCEVWRSSTTVLSGVWLWFRHLTKH